MSTPPPPPPPPVQPLGGMPPGAASRLAFKQQQRAQKAQLRQQREMERAQRRAQKYAYRRGSVLGPVLLLSAGVAFLMFETGALSVPVAQAFLIRWWPLTLIAAGFVLLAEWSFDRAVAARRGTPQIRRSVGPGTGLLLTLVVLSGLFALGLRNNLGGLLDHWQEGLPAFNNGQWPARVFAHHADTPFELTATLNPGATLTIRNHQGNITVGGVSPDNAVHVHATQHVTAWKRSDLRSKQQRDQPRLQPDGNGLLLSVEDTDQDKTDLTIEVPHDAALVIAPEQGDVTVNELRGPVTIEEHHGNLSLTALTGKVQVAMQDQDASVSAHSLSGEVSLEGESGDLSFSDISGPLTLRGDFFGTTHLERIQGPLRFQTSFTQIACAAVPGELNVQGRDDLEGKNLTGPVTVTTTNRNLNLSGVHNGATLTDRNGSVTLSLAEPLGPVNIVTTDEPIELTLPANAGFAVKASTTDGQIHNHFGPKAAEHEDQTSLATQVRSGGPHIALQTTRADINIRKGGSGDSEETRTAQGTD